MAGVPLQVGQSAIFLALLGGLGLVGCRKEARPEEAGVAPPPVAQHARCAPALAPLIPARVAGFCVDADTDHRRYGTGTAAPLEAVCTELFNGDCELYRRFGLERVETFAFVHESTPSRRIAVTQSRFDSPLGAYGFFQRRVVGDAELSSLTVRKLPVRTLGVLGSGVSYLWRGSVVWEMVYLSELDPPQVIENLATEPLSELSARLAEQSGERDEPLRILEIVRKIPGVAVDDLSVRVQDGELLGRAQSSQFVLGIALKGDVAFQVLVAQLRDGDAAKDLLAQVARGPLGEKWETTRVLDLRRIREGAEPEDWSLGIEGRYLLGVAAASGGRVVAKEERVALLALLRSSARDTAR